MKRHTSRKLDEHACGKVQGQSSRTSISTESSTEVSRSLNSEGHFHQQTMFDNDHPRPVDSAKQLAGKKRPSSNSMAQPPSSKRLHSGTASKVGKRKTLHHESELPSAHMQSQAKRARFEEESQRKRQSLPSNSSSHINPYSRAVDNFTVTKGGNTPTISNPPHHQENNTSTEVPYQLTRANTPISSNHAASKVACKQNLLIKQTPKKQPTGDTSVGVKDAQPNTPTISAKTRTSGQSSGNKGFSRTSTPTSTDLDKAQTKLGGHTTKKTSFDKTNADIQSSSIETLALPVAGVSDSGRKAKKGGVRGKKNHAQSDQPLTVTRKTNKFNVFSRSKPHPQLKSKTSGDARVRRSRCPKAERHRCPSCSRPDCGKCKNCL